MTTAKELRDAALTELDWLEGYMGHQVFEDGSDGFDHFIPIRRFIEANGAWKCDWTPDELNPGPDCPYCAGQMCARFDGLGCTHNREERHGYPVEVPA